MRKWNILLEKRTWLFTTKGHSLSLSLSCSTLICIYLQQKINEKLICKSLICRRLPSSALFRANSASNISGFGSSKLRCSVIPVNNPPPPPPPKLPPTFDGAIEFCKWCGNPCIIDVAAPRGICEMDMMLTDDGWTHTTDIYVSLAST